MSSYCAPDEIASSTVPRAEDVKAKGSIELVNSRLTVAFHRYQRKGKRDILGVSSYHEIGRLPWLMRTRTECSQRTDNVKRFFVDVACNIDSSSPLWSCEAFVEIRLRNQQESAKPFIYRFTHTFNHKCQSRASDLMECSEIMDSKNGFIKNDSLILEADISVLEAIGVRLSPRFDFTTPHPRSDGVLLIGNVRLHVNKSYLALYSPVFSAMFYGEFKEGILDEIPLEDTILEEFVELLRVIYPSHIPISIENVDFLLKLGDKYNVHYVMEACEDFLIGASDGIPIIKKLLWAEQYKLAALQDLIIKEFENLEDVQELKRSPRPLAT